MKKFTLLFVCLSCLLIHGYCKTVMVKNTTELVQANEQAVPGDIIILKNGDWRNSKLILTCSGTSVQPITFKAEKRGQVMLSGNSFLRISGNYLIVDGLQFINGAAPNGSVWEFKEGNTVASHCRITNCLVNSFNNADKFDENYWVALYGKNNRIDHCSFLNKTNAGVLLAVILDDERSRLNNHSIDSNYFGVRKPLAGNGGEIIRVGVSQHCTFYSNTVIRDNLFQHCDGETEIISIKSCGNIIRNNVFKKCQGALVLRHGNNNTVEGNIFWGSGKEGSGGVRVINEGNWIVNNFFLNCVGEGFRSPLSIMNGVFNSPPHRYLPVRDAVIANNTFFNCSPVSLGEGADTERAVPPANVYCFNNIFYSNNTQPLFYSYSSTDSIYFNGNIASKALTGAPNSFYQQPLMLQKWDAAGFPVAATVENEIVLPDSIKQQEYKRLQKGLSKTIGCRNLIYFKSMFAHAAKMGIQWKIKPLPVQPTINKPVACKNAVEIYRVLSANTTNCNIQLTGKEYVFDKPVVINARVSITGNNQPLTFKTTQALPALFVIKENSSFSLKNIYINASEMHANYFVLADSTGNSIHFTLTILNCSFTNVTAVAFYNGAKHSYADQINISKTSFSNNNCCLFLLKDEIDNKGYYNAEKLTMANCLFSNNKGMILNLYRGGSDESTMGPRLFFTGNTLTNCNSDAALLNLFGVQHSSLLDNTFTNCNSNGTVLLYTDNVRAAHLQKNNLLNHSGIISENKFVKNIK
jgi:poly(beta-D-mannuronate) lyase